MTDIRFYHLQTTGIDRALPEILSKAFAQGKRVIVKMPDDKTVKQMNDHLWTFRADTFLPHGSAKDGHAEDQPIWLTTDDDNPNGATVLVLTGGATSEKIGEFDLCCDMLDGRDETAVAAARQRWKTYKEKDYNVTYWQQTVQGGWEQKT